jgi:hypothetical protein
VHLDQVQVVGLQAPEALLDVGADVRGTVFAALSKRSRRAPAAMELAISGLSQR